MISDSSLLFLGHPVYTGTTTAMKYNSVNNFIVIVIIHQKKFRNACADFFLVADFPLLSRMSFVSGWTVSSLICILHDVCFQLHFMRNTL